MLFLKGPKWLNAENGELFNLFVLAGLISRLYIRSFHHIINCGWNGGHVKLPGPWQAGAPGEVYAGWWQLQSFLRVQQAMSMLPWQCPSLSLQPFSPTGRTVWERRWRTDGRTACPPTASGQARTWRRKKLRWRHQAKIPPNEGQRLGSHQQVAADKL